DKEIVIGQKALFNEITVNGNAVVLTFNQLVDSRGFFSLLDVPEYYNSLIELFDKGAIRISQFGDIRTIAQYLINSFDYDKEFIYSGWPLKSTQKRLLALIKRSLIYCDLSEIYGYMSGARSEEEVRDLFVEVVNHEERASGADTALLMQEIENLYWFLKTVLRLSAMHSIYIAPKDVAEYSDKKLRNILSYALEFSHDNDPLWDGAAALLRRLPCFGQTDNRSVLIRAIMEEYRGGADKQTCMYAEAIVNVCYNYACEISICNISKHYNISELSPDCSDRKTFREDFFSRLAQDWNVGSHEQRYLQEETDVFDEYLAMDDIPNLADAVRLFGYTAAKDSPAEEIPRYEFNISEQRKARKKRVLCVIGKQVLFSLICVIIACVIEVGFNLLQDVLDGFFDMDTFAMGVLETVLFLFVTEGVTTLLSEKIPGFLSLSEALGGIGRLFKDAVRTLSDKNETYRSRCRDNLSDKERPSKGKAVKSICSDMLKKYIGLYRRDDSQQLFAPSSVYPLAQVDSPEVLEELTRLEELHNYRFGMVYNSRFNTMLADPIRAKDGSFFPYERIVPSAGNGVVMVTVHDGKLVLLRQYRHALRAEQYSFPRGYGEHGILSRENALKEIREEMNAQVSREPVFLGSISPDTGLTSSCAN
ncbi:MAG: NUDIX hydrolase, partial [Oscillospiraceae bacterium]